MTRLELFLSTFTKIQPGEGKSIALLFVNAFILLLSYYLLKPLKESLLLADFSAEVRSYAVAVIALLLIFLVPLYGVLFRHVKVMRLIRWITIFFGLNLLLFFVLGIEGYPIGFAFFVWMGIFGVMIIAQFWAFATDIYNLKSGQRIFPVIMVGASLGGLAGAQLSKYLYALIGPHWLMLVAGISLMVSLSISGYARSSVPLKSRATPSAGRSYRLEPALGGIGMVFNDAYLRLMAVFIVLLNWINSTGEYILAEAVVRHANLLAQSSPAGLQTSEIIADFYSDFILWVTLLGLLIQVFVVSKIYRFAGLCKALMILPILAVVGYGVLGFVPIFSIILIFKTLENSVNYSIMTTTRHAMFLPTNRAAKFEGKIAIDTFFWRFGDLVQAVIVYTGLNWWSFETRHFAMVNFVLAMVWVVVGMAIARQYHALVRANESNAAPRQQRAIPDAVFQHGQPLLHRLAADTFRAPDKGGVLTCNARLQDGRRLPDWLKFDARQRVFHGKPPGKLEQDLVIEVTAVDVDKLSSSCTFSIRQIPDPV